MLDLASVARMIRDMFPGNTRVDSVSVEETNKDIYEIHIIIDKENKG